jgi:hypothetical protein
MKLLAEISAVFADVIAAIEYVRKGKPDDPKAYASDPVSFWHKAAPVANVEKKRKSNVVELDTDTYSEAEIMAMSDAEFRVKIGATGIQTRQSAIKELRKKNKPNAKEIEL